MFGTEDKLTRLRIEDDRMRWILMPRGIALAERSVQDGFLDCLGGDRRCAIGDCCYYITVLDNAAHLCRQPRDRSRGKDLEVVDHDHHGISSEELEDAVRKAAGDHLVDGHYPLSITIEKMLRAQLEP
jgi:hypothetical protein